MKFTRLLFTVATVLSLSACASSSNDLTRDTLTTTIQATSNRIPEAYVNCVTPQLQAQYPSASLRYKSVNYYEGYLPGVDRDNPRASYHVFSSTDDILAKVTLKQIKPVDQQFLEIFQRCL